MRIASSSFLPKAITLSVLLLASAGAYAADTLVPPAPALSIPAAPLPAATTSAPALAQPGSFPIATEIVRPQSGGDIERNISAMEDKVSENAKNVLRHLDAAPETTTYTELNSARQTVSRLEAMIDVEKRLAELEKVRGERTGAHALAASSFAPPTAFASAIPASALLPPPAPSKASTTPDTSSGGGDTPSFGSGRPEISRIYGIDGKYTAVLKLSGGDLKMVRVGDSISNSETVQSISVSSVGVAGNGRSYTLHVKNVNAIYSAMR